MSRTGRTSTKEPGRNARMLLRSTVKPPLTLPLITPVTMSFFSYAASSSIQDSARFAFSRDSLVAPKPSSTVSSATFTMWPISRAKLPCSSRNSDLAITPSDLRPAWTVTQSESISITVPATIAPGFISISLRLASNNSAKLSLMLCSISVVLVVGRLSLTLDSLLRAPAATVLLLNSTARHQCW